MEREELQPPSIKEVKRTVNSHNNSEAAYYDGVLTVIWKYGGHGRLNTLSGITIEVQKEEQVPSVCRITISRPVYIKGRQIILQQM